MLFTNNLRSQFILTLFKFFGLISHRGVTKEAVVIQAEVVVVANVD